jgi:hypothetical protein
VHRDDLQHIPEEARPYTRDAAQECAAPSQAHRPDHQLLTVQEILDEEHEQKWIT